MWRNNVCKNYLIDKRVSYSEAMAAKLLNKENLPRPDVLEPGMSAGGVTFGGQSILLDSWSAKLRTRCIESLPMDLIVDLLLHWLDPSSAAVLALTIPYFYPIYKSLFPQPINLNVVLDGLAPDRLAPWPGQPTGLFGAERHFNLLKLNLPYPVSHYFYRHELNIRTKLDSPCQFELFGRFVSREVYKRTDRTARENQVAMRKLQLRYTRHGYYTAHFLPLTGVPLQWPYNLGEDGWERAVMEMLNGVVTTMDNPASLLLVKRKGRRCFPWPVKLDRLIANKLLAPYEEWIQMIGF